MAQLHESLPNSQLCTTCSAIDFASYFSREIHCHRGRLKWPSAGPDAIRLGYLDELVDRSSRCAFCRLAVETCSRRKLRHQWKTPNHLLREDLVKGTRTEYYIYSYLFANESGIDPRAGRPLSSPPLLNEAYRIGIATRVLSDANAKTVPETDEVGIIQLCGTDAPKIGKNRLFYGRRLGCQFNIELARHWLDICERYHGETCQISPVAAWNGSKLENTPRNLLVIDLLGMCICELPANARYVALSYCWPRGKVFTTTRSNLEDMRTLGSLKRHANRLCAPINDAIQFTQVLDEPFLWVDSLCIVQDDESHKGAQIHQMDLIYTSATLCIICAPNRESISPTKYDGFPGVHLRSNRLEQAIEELKGLTLMNTLPSLEDAMSTSRWSRRAWTFQEQILAPRKLYFTDTQVYFQCRNALFCEDSIAETAVAAARCYPGSNLFHQDHPMHNNTLGNDYGSRCLPRTLEVVPRALMKSFNNLLHDYSRRELTYSEDILYAFEGVMSVYRRNVDMEFIFGLSELHLHEALLWNGTSNVSRRKFARYHGATVAIPSWSWAGWNWSPGSGFSPDAFMRCVVRPEVEWAAVLQDGTQIKLCCKSFEKPGDAALEPLRSEDRNLRPPEKPPGAFSDSIMWKDQDYRSHPNWHVLKYLVCWTRVASFDVRVDVNVRRLERTSTVDFRSGELLVISDNVGYAVGSIAIGKKWVGENVSRPQTCEFMMLSRLRYAHTLIAFDRSIFPEREWAYVVVMLIERSRDTATRVGLGVIHEDAWKQAPPTSMLIKLE